MKLLKRLWLRMGRFVGILGEGEKTRWTDLLREACQEDWTIVASEGSWVEALEARRLISMVRQYE